MKKYYLHNEAEQQGPFDIEELKFKNISKKTPIWYDGLTEWTIAENIDELKSLFASTPPPFKTSNPSPPVQKKEIYSHETKTDRNRTKDFIIGLSVIIVIILIVSFFLGMFKSSNDGAYETSSETYEEKVMSVEEIERSQPTNYLSADGNYNQNFWGDKIKVHGVITNVATVATYKDAVVRVTYYSKTKTELGSKEYIIYDNFPPHSEVRFELKIENYKDVNSIGWDVIQATAN